MGVVLIHQVLNSTQIFRLRQTWATVDAEHKTILENLCQTVTPNKGYMNYRKRFERTTRPAIPLIWLMLSDAMFIQDGFQPLINNKVNFLKLSKLDRVVSCLVTLRVPYQFVPDSIFLGRLKFSLRSTLKEDELYKLSIGIEPRHSNHT
jgi:hypothetical protein